MEHSGTKLVIHSTLWALGVVLMLLGITWLMFLGLSLIMLASFFSSQRRTGGRGLAAFLICAAAAAAILFRDLHAGVAFAQEARPWWFWILILGAGLGGILSEFRRWQADRRLTP
jgi:hypothetical protein